MKYKAIILDLDGTLTNKKKELTERTRAALEALQRRGVKVVLASGRPTYGIVPLAEQLDMARYGGYILAYNGGVIVDCASGEEIYAQTLAAELIPSLYAAAKATGCEILSYDGCEIVTESPENQYVGYEAMLNKMAVRGTESFVETFARPLPKCLGVGEPECAEAMVKLVDEQFGDEMNVYRSEPFFVELVPLNVDKAQSLSRLAEIIGITSNDMIAFGDGFNDLSMIEYAGCGVAMANAQDIVRASADAVTLSNEEDGVAHYIESNLL